MTKEYQDINIPLQISLTKVEKDLEYLIKSQKRQEEDMVSLREDVELLKQFFNKWKGAALILMGLGGLLAWLVDSVLKVTSILR